jgi:hypothetical protein
MNFFISHILFLNVTRDRGSAYCFVCGPKGARVTRFITAVHDATTPSREIKKNRPCCLAGDGHERDGFAAETLIRRALAPHNIEFSRTQPT